MIRPSIKLAAAAAAGALALAGCALLSTPDPVQTYRFGGPAAAGAAANRDSAIGEAIDIATRDLNTQIVGWTDANAG